MADRTTPEATGSISAPPVPDPRRLRRRLVGDLDNIVLMALRKEPERRYASVVQLSEDLHRHLTGRPVLAPTDSLRYRCGKFVRRHRLGVLTAAAFLIAVLGFGIVMAIQRSEIARERDRLDEQRQKTETERLRAERVTSFLIDLFEASDPFSSRVDAGSVTARQLLDRGAQRLAKLEAEPGASADLSHTIGVIYRRIGLSDEAKPLLDYALSVRQATPASDPAKVAGSFHWLALILQSQGDHDGAEHAYRETLTIQRRLTSAAMPSAKAAPTSRSVSPALVAWRSRRATTPRRKDG